MPQGIFPSGCLANYGLASTFWTMHTQDWNSTWLVRIASVVPAVVHYDQRKSLIEIITLSLESLQFRDTRQPNQAMQRTAGRSAFPLSMTSTFNQQPHAPSPAVADLGSR